ncbi:4-hydroxy-tetrahydrodipicolinate synthase [Arachidicoccus ginsenosidimutans]|uniref:4-hydroxy-tetrahydrodipicolinate synthase n=1 Tax=Arachidicoccus sp. BS20 TaxID=1850526 RepID=UPI0007F10E0A|nr:4-hydroxy-tetrahydrodipicolinate synthase [Arachidicoccus sp. BS20]ANI89121.1 4-hydroxy-tetrahydrodipicolinate synthase [Arachidicoccus sp. BS20]
MSLKNILKGTGVAIVTPFKKDFSIDYEALENVINYQIDNGINYIVTLGTTGETPTISVEEQKEIILFTYEKINERVPVVVGIGGNNTQNVIEHLQSYPLDEAVAVLSASPYYSKPSQEGLYQHYKAIASVSPKPILVYNVPARTGKSIDASTVVRLAKEVKNIAGIKEASGDFAQFVKIINNVPEDFLVTSGDDNLIIPQIAIGMQGVISVMGNAYPKEISTVVNLALENKFAEANAAYKDLVEACELMFNENNPAGVKAFMHEKGLLENVLRLPLVALSESNHQKIKNYLKK